MELVQIYNIWDITVIMPYLEHQKLWVHYAPERHQVPGHCWVGRVPEVPSQSPDEKADGRKTGALGRAVALQDQ